MTTKDKSGNGFDWAFNDWRVAREKEIRNGYDQSLNRLKHRWEKAQNTQQPVTVETS